MEHSLMQLPYAMDALKTSSVGRNLEYHYGKHHANYVKKLNELVNDDLEFKDRSLVEIIKTSSGVLFNNARKFITTTFTGMVCRLQPPNPPQICKIKSKKILRASRLLKSSS